MQQRNSYKSVENFLDDLSFRKWVLEGLNSQDWEEWTLENPSRAKLVVEAREWLLALHIPEENVSDQEVEAALRQTWSKIRATQKTTNPLRQLLRWQVAASVLLMVALLGWLYKTQRSDRTRLKEISGEIGITGELTEKHNTTDQPLLVMLSDGSSILLQPNSILRYPSVFGDSSRIVHLHGDGFFEVSKNAKKPFYVYANEVVTKVIGTSFRVKAFAKQKSVEVVVRTGKVNVTTPRGEKEEVLLLPNQGVRFIRESLKFEKIEDLTQEKNHSQELSSIEKLSFEFTDVPVAQIFRTIEQAYLVKINFPFEKLEDCYLTTSLSDQPLAEKLKIICESLGDRTGYVMKENTITILSNGCN